MSRATHALEWESAAPTHMLTLTLPPQCWEALLSDGDRLSLWETAKARWLRMLSDRMRGSGAGWLWFVEFQRRRGAPHLHVLIQLDVPFLSAPEYADWQRWLTESWGRCLGLPAPYATRIEALRERDFRYARAYAVKTEQKTFLFRVGGVVSGAVVAPTQALLPVLRLSASSSFCLMWRPISSLGLWAYPLLREFSRPRPITHVYRRHEDGVWTCERGRACLCALMARSPASRCSASMSFAVRLLNLLRGTVRGGWASC